MHPNALHGYDPTANGGLGGYVPIKASEQTLQVVPVGANTTGQTAKNRTAIAVTNTEESVYWQVGDDITEITVTCVPTGGSTITAGNYGIVCFDTTAAIAGDILGATTSIKDSPTANCNAYIIPVNASITFHFDTALSDTSEGGEGNAWCRSAHNTQTLDFLFAAS